MESIQKRLALCAAISALFVFASLQGLNPASAAARSYYAPMAATFRIRAENVRGHSLITGHGTAFGIDMSEFGYRGSRYLLTACHVVREHDGTLVPSLKIEVFRNGMVRWVRCRLLASDARMDIALLESECDVPCSRLALHDALRGDFITMVGSPAGVPLRAFEGRVMENKHVEHSLARVEYIKEGCSGGPLFDGRTQGIVGVVVAGIGVGRSQSMDPHTCLYISNHDIRLFVRRSISGHYQAAPAYGGREYSYGAPQYRGNVQYRRGEYAASDSTGMWLP